MRRRGREGREVTLDGDEDARTKPGSSASSLSLSLSLSSLSRSGKNGSEDVTKDVSEAVEETLDGLQL